MKIIIRGEDCSEVWDGVFYKKLSDYPRISDWELKTILDFIAYERQYGRECPIVCQDPGLLSRILSEIKYPEKYAHIACPKLLTECTACPVRKGCETRFVCHTTSPENAISILKCGSLLSAVKARGLSARELAAESRNAAADPEDYFDYIMFSWGNCQGGDRLVTERRLGRFPNEMDLSRDFMPGIRFYFEYDRLRTHPKCVLDGVLPLKIRDELQLKPWLHAMVIPCAYREQAEPYIGPELQPKVLYADHACRDIWEWSEKVYTSVEALDANAKEL